MPGLSGQRDPGESKLTSHARYCAAALRLLWPRTMFGRQVLVLLGCLFLTQIVFVSILLRQPNVRSLASDINDRAEFVAYVVKTIELVPRGQREPLMESPRLARAGVHWLPEGPAASEWRPMSGLTDTPEVASLAQLLPAGAKLVQRPTGANPPHIAVRLRDGSIIEFAPRFDMPRGYPWLPIGNMLLLTLGLTLGGYLVTRQVTRPLSRLVKAADAIGADVRVAPAPLLDDGPIEVRQLAHALNVMREGLTRYLGSRSVMLAAMSHDLKTPLTRMRLRVEALEDPALRGRFVADLAEMEELVQSTLELLRGQSAGAAPQPIALGDLLQEIVSEFRELGGRVALDATCTAKVDGHRLALKRALANLIHNSIKYAGSAEVHATSIDGEARIIIADRGPGIPETDLVHVFEPFYRVDSSRNRATGGTGLGLAIALDAIRLHRGSIDVTNRDDGGLEVDVRLPTR